MTTVRPAVKRMNSRTVKNKMVLPKTTLTHHNPKHSNDNYTKLMTLTKHTDKAQAKNTTTMTHPTKNSNKLIRIKNITPNKQHNKQTRIINSQVANTLTKKMHYQKAIMTDHIPAQEIIPTSSTQRPTIIPTQLLKLLKTDPNTAIGGPPLRWFRRQNRHCYDLKQPGPGGRGWVFREHMHPRAHSLSTPLPVSRYMVRYISNC